MLMSATVDSSVLESYFHPILVSKPYFVGAKRFPVAECFIDNFASFTPPMENASSQRFHQSICNLLSKLPKECPIKMLHSKVKLDNKLLNIAVKSVFTYGQVGQSVLIFLPGFSEITSMHSAFEDFIVKEHLKDNVNISVLHSNVPVEDQQAAFESPSSTQMHVILATDIAESSVTLPNVGLVINTCIRNQLEFIVHRRVSILKKSWCSKASCIQRSGRAGRQLPGRVIHFIPKKLYEALPDRSVSEMLCGPIERLLLQAREIGSFFNLSLPSQVLDLALFPPSKEQIAVGVENLALAGAMVSETGKTISQTSSLTLFGRIALALPVDISLSRLVFLGCILGVVYEAVIIAASLAIEHDLFVTPSYYTSKTEEKYSSVVANSLICRFRYDGGEYSEALQICSVVHDWIRFRSSKKQGVRSLCNEFCKIAGNEGIHAYRLHELVVTISMITRRLQPFSNGTVAAQLRVLSSIHNNIVLVSLPCRSDTTIVKTVWGYHFQLN